MQASPLVKLIYTYKFSVLLTLDRINLNIHSVIKICQI